MRKSFLKKYADNRSKHYQIPDDECDIYDPRFNKKVVITSPQLLKDNIKRITVYEKTLWFESGYYFGKILVKFIDGSFTTMGPVDQSYYDFIKDYGIEPTKLDYK